MNKKFFIIGIFTSIFIILIALGSIFLFIENLDRKTFTTKPSDSRKILDQYLFRELGIKDEKSFNKLKNEVTDLDLSADEAVTYYNSSRNLTFSIPYNQKWGGKKYKLNIFDEYKNTVSFGNGGLYFAEMTPKFQRSMSFSELEPEVYDEIKNIDAKECEKPEKIKIGENIFLKQDECGMLDNPKYFLQDFYYTFMFENIGESEENFYKILESVKHTDGTPFKEVFLANLDMSGATTIFSYKDENINLSFSYPKRWGEPNFYYTTSTDELDAKSFIDQEEYKKQINHVIHTGRIYINFYDISNSHKICPYDYGCGISLSFIPYDKQKYLMVSCGQGDCRLSDNIFSIKDKLISETNYTANNYPATLEDSFFEMGGADRYINFFTPKYYVGINFNIRPNITSEQSLEFEKEENIKLEEIIEKSKNPSESKAVLQEFTNMVESLEIK